VITRMLVVVSKDPLLLRNIGGPDNASVQASVLYNLPEYRLTLICLNIAHPPENLLDLTTC
jgi:hypothetical protein